MASYLRGATILATVAAVCALLAVAGLTFIYSGVYDIGATTPHWPVTEWLLRTVRMRSIERHAADIHQPAGLDTQANILMGVEHFSTHCAICHGAPGVPKDDIAEGLYPQPPNLAVAAKQFTAGELFWILKHGIKMTGMPAWSDHTDPELWAIVAFLEKLPTMSEADYANLVKETVMRGMHHNMQGMDMHESGGH